MLYSLNRFYLEKLSSGQTKGLVVSPSFQILVFLSKSDINKIINLNCKISDYRWINPCQAAINYYSSCFLPRVDEVMRMDRYHTNIYDKTVKYRL